MKKITITEQVGCGNFAGETDEEQKNAAIKYAEMMEQYLIGYSKREYPGYEINVNFSVENVSGCTRQLSVSVEGYDFDDECASCAAREIEADIIFVGERYAEKIASDIYL